jgi:hypothetical protein
MYPTNAAFFDEWHFSHHVVLLDSRVVQDDFAGRQKPFYQNHRFALGNPFFGSQVYWRPPKGSFFTPKGSEAKHLSHNARSAFHFFHMFHIISRLMNITLNGAPTRMVDLSFDPPNPFTVLLSLA